MGSPVKMLKSASSLATWWRTVICGLGSSGAELGAESGRIRARSRSPAPGLPTAVAAARRPPEGVDGLALDETGRGGERKDDEMG